MRNPIKLINQCSPLKLIVLLTAFSSGVAFQALAHSVWIEDTPEKRLVLRFGEFGDDVEKSPGHLDSLTAVTAWTHDADGKPTPFDPQKKSDGFLLAGASSAQAAQAETGFPVMKSGNTPARKPFFYARWQAAGSGAATPALTFDLVPTGKLGEVRVYFRGRPLPEVKLTLSRPGESELELTADKDGFVRFAAAKPGLYLLTCAHYREAQPGFFSGRAYDLVSHNAALAWRQP